MKISNKLLPILVLATTLTGCVSTFSDYKTVYRIDTTTGESYYTSSEPKLNQSTQSYEITNLDGEKLSVNQSNVVAVGPFTHRK